MYNTVNYAHAHIIDGVANTVFQISMLI